MAVSKSIRDEMAAVFDARVEAQCFYKALEAAELDQSSNPMIYAFRCQVERLDAACEALEVTIRQRVLPLLQDFEGITK